MAARNSYLAKVTKQPICLSMKPKRHFTKETYKDSGEEDSNHDDKKREL
ncbi:hypothetical protein HC752_24540 [Vibrio sp. S9_S30]|nr:hypothetical protein [Vibrio sp. S9_S30]MBD1560074.1 hypothetical protein [Vibrio sp. S9_S30]